MWLTKLENYFESHDVPPEEWTNLAISWVSESCLRNLPPIQQLKQDKDGYESFKKALIDKYGRTNRERVTLTSFTAIYQRSDENVRDYGNAIKEMAEKLFKDASDRNSHLNEQFPKGIRDSALSAKALDKFHKMQGKEYSFNEFFENMIGKEAGRVDFARSTSGTETEDTQARSLMRLGNPNGGFQQNRGQLAMQKSPFQMYFNE